MTRAKCAWERVYHVLVRLSPLVSRGGLVRSLSSCSLQWPVGASAPTALVSIEAGVTRAGTACRSSYRPSRHRSRCDAYSPPNYYTTSPHGIKTSNLRATVISIKNYSCQTFLNFILLSHTPNKLLFSCCATRIMKSLLIFILNLSNVYVFYIYFKLLIISSSLLKFYKSILKIVVTYVYRTYLYQQQYFV